MKTRTKVILGGAALLLAMAAFVPHKLRALAGTPVQVVNTLPEWIPTGSIDEPGRNPVEIPFNLSCQNCGMAAEAVYTVSADKRLVIQNVSGRCQEQGMGADFIGFGQIFTTVNTYFVPASTFTTGDGLSLVHFSMFATLTRAYADPGTLVNLSFTGKSPSSRFLVCDGSISGYLADLVPPSVNP